MAEGFDQGGIVEMVGQGILAHSWSIRSRSNVLVYSDGLSKTCNSGRIASGSWLRGTLWKYGMAEIAGGETVRSNPSDIRSHGAIFENPTIQDMNFSLTQAGLLCLVPDLLSTTDFEMKLPLTSALEGVLGHYIYIQAQPKRA